MLCSDLEPNVQARMRVRARLVGLFFVAGFSLVLLCATRIAAEGIDIGGSLENTVCKEVYARNPLEFAEGSSATCFGGNPLSVDFGSMHKSGNVFSYELLHTIMNYCSEVAKAADELEHVPQLWKCGTGIQHLRSREDEGYAVGFSHCQKYFPEESCTPTESDFGRAKIVHFIRDPFDIILSAYNYHLRGTERWERVRGWHKSSLPDFVEPSLHGKSYTKILSGLNEADGIRLEALRIETHIRRMVTGFCRLNGEDGIYLPVRFADFLGAERIEEYCQLLRFIGMREEHASKLASSMSSVQNSSAPTMNAEGSTNRTKHITAGSFDKETQLRILEQLDTYHQILEAQQALEHGWCDSCTWCKTRFICGEKDTNNTQPQPCLRRPSPVPCTR